MKKVIATCFLLIIIFCLHAQNAISQKDDTKLKGLSAITDDVVKGQLEFLASDWTEGRETGTKGSFLAADYVASIFKIYGLKPIGDMEPLDRSRGLSGMFAVRNKTYFQDFTLIENQMGDEQHCQISFSDGIGSRNIDLIFRSDFYSGVPEAGFELNAPIVFVGYGIVDELSGVNELKGLNLKGKIVLRIQGIPGMNNPQSEGMKKLGGKYISKDALLMQRGALAVVDIANENDLQSWVDNYPFHVKSNVFEGDKMPESLKIVRIRIPADTLSTSLKRILISKRAANEILRESGITVDRYITQAADLKFPVLKNLTGVMARIAITVKSRLVKGRNIIGLIEGENLDEYVVIGGHYDHMGIQNGFIFNGADDNASGSVGVMTMAKACMATGVKPKKSIIFALWTGEEKGLLGSQYFADNSPYKDKKIVFYLNYDMISRNSPTDTEGKAVAITYTKAFPAFEEISNKNMRLYGIDLKPGFMASEKPRGGSDFTAFSLRGIPLMAWNAGMHPDYHQATDEVPKTNWPKMINIIKLGFLDVWDIVNGDLLNK